MAQISFIRIIKDFFSSFLVAEKVRNIRRFEKKVFSQNGEDGIIEKIFEVISTTNKYFVEFGVESGLECNTRYLRKVKGWTGLLMDGSKQEDPFIHEEFITAENINQLFEKYDVPTEFDLLSIDIDSNDYWVWKAIEHYSPRVVVIEYNASIPPDQAKVVSYDVENHWDGTNYFGASLLALVKLGTEKGYTLVGCDSRGINAFFIRNDLLQDRFELHTTAELYSPPAYGKQENGKYLGHPVSTKKMIDI